MWKLSLTKPFFSLEVLEVHGFLDMFRNIWFCTGFLIKKNQTKQKNIHPRANAYYGLPVGNLDALCAYGHARVPIFKNEQ